MNTHRALSEARNRASVTAWLASAAVSALAFTATPVRAQTTASVVTVEDVIVTATRRETRLQDTPIAVTAVTGSAAEQAHVQAVRDLTKVTPGLTFAAVSGLETPVTLRGIGSTGLGIGGDSPTAIYLDGVYLAQPHAATFSFADIDRIEVLRGPQGTLYGQNSTAGAIKVITSIPGEKTQGRFSIDAGSFGLLSEKGTVSGPLVEDKLYLKVSGAHRQQDGFYTNFYTGKDDGSTDETTLSGALRWTPSARIDLILRGDWTKNNIQPIRQLLFSSVATDTPPTPCAPAHCDLTFTKGQPDPIETFKSGGVSFTGKLELDQVTLTSVSAYRELHTFFLIDNSAVAASLFPLQNKTDDRQYTQEFDLASTGSGPLQFVAGAFYLHESAAVVAPLQFTNTLLVPDINRDGVADNLQAITWSNVKSDAYALFGEANYSVTDKLKLTAGLRYGHSEKSLLKDTLSRIVVSPAPPVIGAFTGLPGRSAAPAAARKDLSASWDYLIPRVIAAYQFAPHTMAYASVSKGFKNGGYDFGATNPGPFSPEKLWTYEAGVKADLFDRMLRTNLSVYRSDYKNLQLTIQDALGNRVTRNAASSRIYGVELEYALRPASAFSIDGFLTYTDAKFKNFVYDVSGFGLSPAANCFGGTVVRTGFCDLSGNRVPRTPKWTFALNAQYEFTVPDGGTLTPRLSYNYQSRAYLTIQNVFPAAYDHVTQLDGMVTWAPKGERWQLSAYGQNLTNYRYVAGAGDANISASNNPLDPLPRGARRIIGNPNPPRTFGASVKYQF